MAYLSMRKTVVYRRFVIQTAVIVSLDRTGKSRSLQGTGNNELFSFSGNMKVDTGHSNYAPCSASLRDENSSDI